MKNGGCSRYYWSATKEEERSVVDEAWRRSNRPRTFFGVDAAFNQSDACHVIELLSRDDTSSGLMRSVFWLLCRWSIRVKPATLDLLFSVAAHRRLCVQSSWPHAAQSSRRSGYETPLHAARFRVVIPRIRLRSHSNHICTLYCNGKTADGTHVVKIPRSRLDIGTSCT